MIKFIIKWQIYQKERFPLVQYIPLIAAFSFCAVSYSAILRNSTISLGAFLSAFITSFSFFMLLRIADEFKDFEEDSKFRPYRPVPRGLIKLKELAIVGVVLLIIQFGVASIYYSNLLYILFLIWIYFWHLFFLYPYLSG